jgi:chaperonin cofactor prefoldin
MITGPARFPVRRAEKANQSEDNRWRDLQEFRARAKKAIIKKVQPYGDGSRIVSHDPEAVAKLREKLDNLKKSQETMKAANRIIRSKSTDHDTKLAKLRELGIPAAETLFKPDFCGRVGFADYQLQNNNANIKRVEARIKELSAAPEGLELEKGEVRIFEGDGRIQVEFPGKPPESTRSTLKRNGFKWSPSRGTWVRMANGTARNVARLLLDEIA